MVTMEYGIVPDKYVTAVAGMFGPANEPPETPLMRGTALNPGAYKYVLLGHTHDDKQVDLKDLGATYFNTGSWSVQRDAHGKKASRLCYVIIQKDSAGVVAASKSIWKG
jgi:predicted phosphodiesterase